MIKSFLIFLFSLFLLTNNSSADEKIVFIDLNYIFKNSNAGKDLTSQISKKDVQLKDEITQFKKEIETEKKKILSQKNVLSVEEYNKKIINLENKITEMNSVLTNKNSEFALFKKKIEDLFSRELNIVIEEYSIANSINIILNKDNLLMAKKDLDITQQVFSLFNKKVDKIKIN